MENVLETLPVWSKLDKAQQESLAAAAVSRTFLKGTLLHSGAGDCTGLFLVTDGQLRAFTVSEDGREITLYRLFERDMCLFSATCMINSLQVDITIAAEKDTQVVMIPAEVYRRIMEVSAPLANYTNEVMASRFSEVMWLMEQVLWKSFDKRLAEFLLSEAAIDGGNILRITHETIGNHLGNPREVVTRMLNYFVGEGLVALSRGTVEILNEKKLEEMIEG